MKKPVFIMIVGGSASGKSHFYDTHLNHIKLLDIDEYKFRLSGGDFEKASKMVSKVVKLVESDLQDTFGTGEDVVNAGTGQNIPIVLKKFKWAKDAGYETRVIFLDVDVKTALVRNQKRAASGERNLMPDYKIERSNRLARENYSSFASAADVAIKITT